MNRKMTKIVIRIMIMTVLVFLSPVSMVYTVKAADAIVEPLVLNVDVMSGDAVLEHTPDEIYYCNSGVTIRIPQKVKELDVSGEVTASVNEVAVAYPSENVSFYVDEYVGYSVYDGEKFSEYIELDNNDREVMLTASPGELYVSDAYMFRNDFSYKIYREDENGNRVVERIIEKQYVSKVYQFVFDIKAPVFLANDAVISDATVLKESEVSVNITDNCGLKSVKLIKNGSILDTVNLTGDTRITDFKYTVNLTKENEGNDNILLEATDLAGNISEYGFSYRIDNSAPILTLTGADNGKVYAGEVSITAKATDDSESGYIFYKCMFMDENRNTSCHESITEAWKESGGSLIRNYRENGIYSIVSFAYDNSGNYTEVKTVSFAIDNKAPGVSIENVRDGGIYNSAVSVYATLKDLFYENVSARLEGTVRYLGTSENNNQDNIDGSITVSPVYQKLQLDPYSICSVTNKNIYTFSDDGVYRLTFSAEDGNGKNASVDCGFTIDSKAPRISISTSSDDGGLSEIESACLMKRPEITVIAKDDLLPVETEIKLFRKRNDESYELVSESVENSIGKSSAEGNDTLSLVNITDFTVEVPYEGEYQLCVIARDSAGNVSDKSIEFIVDENPPLIGYLDSFNEKYLKEFVLPGDISGYITDMTTVKYRAYLNSKEISDCKINRDGKYMLSVVAQDEAGNVSEEKIAFIVDSRKPKVVVSGIGSNGTVKRGDEIKLSLLDENDYFINATVNGEEVEIVNLGKEVYVDPTQCGTYDIKVTASDYAGNEVTQVIKAECVNLSKPDFIGNESVNLKTLTKNEDEIRESFFKSRWVIIVTVICGIMASAGAVLGVIAFVDRKKVKCDTSDTDVNNNI